jgi:hypothetical protein
MLPQQVIDLLASFVRTFDSERVMVIEFRKARHGFPGLDGGAVITIGGRIASYLEDKARFIWNKCQIIIDSTNVQPYPELASDLKLLISSHYNPSRVAAERHIEELRESVNIPSGYTVETKWAFANILSKINADIDLFCAAHAVQKGAPAPSNIFHIGTVHGAVGYINNSQITVCDYSSVHKLLVERQIPKPDRHELEDIMDELKEAPPEKKPSLIKRGEDWIVKHKELLGAAGDAVGKAIGAAMKP